MPFFVKEGNGGNFTKAKGWLGSQVPYAFRGDKRVVPGFFLGALVKLIEN
jgi:hypothetical protein